MYDEGLLKTSLTRGVAYLQLTRFDKPIGILLLLWPTLWALWFAAAGWPPYDLLLRFIGGVICMRAAGCAVNDWADRHIDGQVVRTKARPLARRAVHPYEALGIAALFALCALGLAWPMHPKVLWFCVPAVAVAIAYPFFKRFFALPQLVLGVAFSFGIPMAYMAVLGYIPMEAFGLFIANMAWTLAYDTEYAMADRADDARLGLRTSALTFGDLDIVAVMSCYALSLLLLAMLGVHRRCGIAFFAGLLTAAGISVYHYWLIRNRLPARCTQAFLHNRWWGAAVFVGIYIDFARIGEI